MLNRGGHLIRSRLDLTSRLDPTIRCLRTGGARLGGYALAPVDTRGKKANRFFPFRNRLLAISARLSEVGCKCPLSALTTKTAEGRSTRHLCTLTNALPIHSWRARRQTDSLSLQVSSAVSQVERCGDTVPIPGRGIISMNSDIGFLQLEESKTHSG